jgi:hypothetical protein
MEDAGTLSTNEYRIEKDRLPVTLILASGAKLSGTVFVQSYVQRRSGREQASDVLNSREPYFPLAVDDGETQLIAKDQVVEVAVGPDVEGDALSAMIARTATVEVTTISGETRVGAVYLEVRNDRPRLLDFLNQFDQRFLTLHADDGLRLINRRLIERVRPLG